MALKTVIEAVKAICHTDPTLNGEQIDAAIAKLDGRDIIHGEPPPRAYTREQVAALLGRSRRTVTMYARRGLLVPLFTGRDGKRAQAYTGESVAALLNGTAKGGAK